MAEFAPWVGKCQFQAINTCDAETPDFEAYVAVWTDSRDGFEAAINTHFEKNTHRLFWTEDVHPALSWLKKFGHNNTIIGLSKSVNEQNLVKMSKLADIDEHGQYLKDEGYLTITEHDIPKLPEQEGIPFWEREWIVPELKELLFGQDENGEKIRTYFIVDATLRKNITGYFDLDSLDVPVQCLFKGEAAEEMKEVAPYLIDMTLPDGAFDDKDKVPDFHKDFFKKHWGQNTGIFIRTMASMDDVWKHFRKFTKVQVEEDRRWVFFRFYDPRIAPSYFDSIRHIPEKAAQWVNLRGKNGIERIIGNQTDLEQPWSITPNWQKIADTKFIGAPILSNVEMQGFTRYRIYHYEKRAMAFFRKQFPKLAKPLSNDQLRKVIQLAYDNAKKRGITTERDHFKYLIIVAYWGIFFETDPQYQTALKKAGWINSDGQVLQHAYLPKLLREIDKHTLSIATDLASYKRVSLSLREVYTQPIPKNISPTIMLKIMKYIWPAHLKYGNMQDFIVLAKNGISKGKNLKLYTRDIIAYVCLCILVTVLMKVHYFIGRTLP